MRFFSSHNFFIFPIKSAEKYEKPIHINIWIVAKLTYHFSLLFWHLLHSRLCLVIWKCKQWESCPLHAFPSIYFAQFDGSERNKKCFEFIGEMSCWLPTNSSKKRFSGPSLIVICQIKNKVFYLASWCIAFRWMEMILISDISTVNRVELIGTVQKHLFTLPSGYKSYIVQTVEPENR